MKGARGKQELEGKKEEKKEKKSVLMLPEGRVERTAATRCTSSLRLEVVSLYQLGYTPAVIVECNAQTTSLYACCWKAVHP